MFDVGAEKDICVYVRGARMVKTCTRLNVQKTDSSWFFKASLIFCPYPMHLCLIAVLAHKLLVNCSAGSSSFRCQVTTSSMDPSTWRLPDGNSPSKTSVFVPERESRYLQGAFSTFWGLVWQRSWQFWHPSLLFFLSAVGQAQIYLVENITGQHHVGRVWSTSWCPS